MSMSLQPFLEFKHSVTVSVHETSSAKLTASVPNKRSNTKDGRNNIYKNR